MNTIEQAREVSARLHLGASIANGRNIDKDVAIIAKAAGNTIDALIAELKHTKTLLGGAEYQVRDLQAKVMVRDSELAALKAQEHAATVSENYDTDYSMVYRVLQKPLPVGARLYLAAGAQTKQVLEKLDELRVSDSMFESWFSKYSPANKGTKQQMRDAYAAGMGDPLVAAAQPVQQELAPHPPTRHCMCDDCKPSFSDDVTPVRAQEQELSDPLIEKLWHKHCHAIGPIAAQDLAFARAVLAARN